MDIRRIEFVDHFELAIERWAVHGVVLVHGRQTIIQDGPPAYEPSGVPTEGQGIATRGGGRLVPPPPAVVGHRLGAACFPDCVHQGIDVFGHLGVGRLRRIERLVDHLEGDHCRVFAVGLAGESVAVGHELTQEALLGFAGRFLGGHLRHVVVVRETVAGIRRAPPGDGSEHCVDPAFARLGQEVVEQCQVFVVEQIPLPVADLAVPAVEPNHIQPQSPEVLQVVADCLPMVQLPPLQQFVVHGERDVVVHPEQRHFLPGVLPTQDPVLPQDCRSLGRGGRHCDGDEDSEQGETTKHGGIPSEWVPQSRLSYWWIQPPVLGCGNTSMGRLLAAFRVGGDYCPLPGLASTKVRVPNFSGVRWRAL